ncbi:INCREASED PETAL GROWTH ANISOTROPY 1-like protein 1 [Elaeis guineensis]|uniref:Protein CHUP1, chloroplastic n=1 Tax=Elaeis guineensis var. tenera TaxID=51953 RepID=A0A6I9R546_ELAGV|nr:protein CHUP1, chloroplastic [Elaeis guineensis]
MPKAVEDTSSVALLKNRLNASLERNHSLEKENEQLRQEIHNLKIQIASLRAQDSDRRSMLWKKLQGSIGNNSFLQEKQMVQSNNTDEGLTCDNSISRPEFSGSPTATRERLPRVPKPPPKPTCLPQTPKTSNASWLPPPPPPPPFPSKLKGGSIKAVQRVPEVVEFYRSLTRKEGKPDTRTGALGIPAVTNAREMIGEIENRSAYLLAIKSDVETQGDFINFLTREVENAAYKEISDVEAFVKWLDEELSYLADERAVLKHFPKWPERKADAMREAACGYRDLKNLESEVSSFRDDMRQPTPVALKRMQALQDKLERSVHNVERVRESASKRYRDFKIPWEWMLDSGIIAQLKLGSMKLAKGYMKRVVTAMKFETVLEDDELIIQGVRFAFRVHQFVGGFDEESRHAFQELKKLASNCQSSHCTQLNGLSETT